MKAYQIVHDMPGRMRIRYGKYTFSKTAAIGLSYELERWKMVNKVEANDITGSILFIYDKNRRRELLALIRQFEIEKFDVTPYLATIKEYNSYEITQKEVSQNYTSKFIKLLLRRYSIRWFLPTPIQYLSSIVLAVKYFKKGLASLGKDILMCQFLMRQVSLYRCLIDSLKQLAILCFYCRYHNY